MYETIEIKVEFFFFDFLEFIVIIPEKENWKIQNKTELFI